MQRPRGVYRQNNDHLKPMQTLLVDELLKPGPDNES